MRYVVEPFTKKSTCQLKLNDDLFYIVAHIAKNKFQKRCFPFKKVGNVTSKQ